MLKVSYQVTFVSNLWGATLGSLGPLPGGPLAASCYLPAKWQLAVGLAAATSWWECLVKKT